MSVEMAIEVIRQAFWVALMVGTPILAIGFIGGVLVSLTMLGGLVGNLILLPLFLSWVSRDRPAEAPDPVE